MAKVIPSPFSEDHFISHQIDNGPDKMQGFPSLLTKKIFYIGIIHQKLKRGTSNGSTRWAYSERSRAA
nr:MAG TPA: hypothetical protein [Bacteriophage sp.]